MIEESPTGEVIQFPGSQEASGVANLNARRGSGPTRPVKQNTEALLRDLDQPPAIRGLRPAAEPLEESSQQQTPAEAKVLDLQAAREQRGGDNE